MKIRAKQRPQGWHQLDAQGFKYVDNAVTQEVSRVFSRRFVYPTCLKVFMQAYHVPSGPIRNQLMETQESRMTTVVLIMERDRDNYQTEVDEATDANRNTT